jgi:hypothetical protein
MSPFALLFQSRKFWLLILDTVISLVLFFVGKYWSGGVEDVKFIVLALQPVFVTLIYAIAKEDAAVKAINGEIIKNSPPVG